MQPTVRFALFLEKAMPIRPCPLRAVFVAAVLFAIANAANASASRVGSYAQLRDALFSGARVTAIFRPALCETAGMATRSNGNMPAIEGGFTVEAFLEATGKYIALSNQHFTVRPNEVPTLELMQYRIMPNQDATVTVRALSPSTYQPLAEERHYRCRLGAGLLFRQ
jgi:hypothetical protein